ncbi:MAG: cobaltochelatase subunit CobN, partial [Pseudomonadota bacterium]
MHLLAATPGRVDDGKEPVDLEQTPDDILFLSAADTELAALSEACTEMDEPPGLRLANITQMGHPMSVDLHLDTCATKCRLVIARVLGGVGYWNYGSEQYAARCHEAGVPLALLPGDDKPDADLRALSTVSDEDYDALWAYLVEGGPENAANFLRYGKAMLDGGEKPQTASPLLRAGVYWPGSGISDLSAAQAGWTDGHPVVPIVFYRALVQG